MLKRLITSIALLTLTACAALGLPTADTFNQKLAVAQVTVTAARTTATDLLRADKISVSDAKNVQDAADVLASGIQGAYTLKAQCDAVKVPTCPAAEDKLADIQAGLLLLQGVLVKYQGGK